MRERLVVVEVVAREEPHDAVAVDLEHAVVEALDAEAAAGGRAEDLVRGERDVERRRRRGAPPRAGRCAAARRRARRAPRPSRSTSRSPARRRRGARATAPPPRAASPGGTRSAFDSASTRGSDASRGSCARSSASIVAWLASGSEPSAGSRSSTWTSRRVRSTWARKSWPRPGALAGALDEAGDVGDDELALGALERAEHRLERRERVRADLRRGARHAREQRRLAGVRDADEADVGEQLQAQVDPALLADEPALGEPRRLARGRREALVAAPARAAARDDDALAGHDEVVRAAVPRRDLRARRDAGSRARARSAPWRWSPSPWPARVAL